MLAAFALLTSTTNVSDIWPNITHYAQLSGSLHLYSPCLVVSAFTSAVNRTLLHLEVNQDPLFWAFTKKLWKIFQEKNHFFTSTRCESNLRLHWRAASVCTPLVKKPDEGFVCDSGQVPTSWFQNARHEFQQLISTLIQHLQSGVK